MDYKESHKDSVSPSDKINKIKLVEPSSENFQGNSSRSKSWFNLDHEWLEEKFCTREPDLYTKLSKINNEGQ